MRALTIVVFERVVDGVHPLETFTVQRVEQARRRPSLGQQQIVQRVESRTENVDGTRHVILGRRSHRAACIVGYQRVEDHRVRLRRLLHRFDDLLHRSDFRLDDSSITLALELHRGRTHDLGGGLAPPVRNDEYGGLFSFRHET